MSVALARCHHGDPAGVVRTEDEGKNRATLKSVLDVIVAPYDVLKSHMYMMFGHRIRLKL